MTVNSLAVQSTTLDDVFVHYTGRALRDALQARRPADSPFMIRRGIAMQRTLAIIEREMRRFRRSPMLIVMSMIMPIVQLVVLGYAFGGNVKHLKVAVVDQDHGVPAVHIRELASAVASGNRTFDIVDYTDPGEALTDLRNGRVNGVLTIPPDFSRRVLARNEPKRRADRGQHRQLRVGVDGGRRSVSCSGRINEPVTTSVATAGANRRSTSSRSIRTCRTCSTCCRARSRMSIFMMVMIGGGIIFIDDKARGLHEGYLVTPITKFELIAGFNISGTIRAVLAGAVIMVIGSLIAGVPNPLDPMRLLRLLTRHRRSPPSR